jgi:hypothetical protein
MMQCPRPQSEVRGFGDDREELQRWIGVLSGQMSTRAERHDRLQVLDSLLDELEELNLHDIPGLPAHLAQRLADSGVVVLGGTVSQGMTAVWNEQARRS